MHSANPFSSCSVECSDSRPCSCTGDCRMQEHRHQRVGGRRLHGALIMVAVCALAFGSVTRFWDAPSLLLAPRSSHTHLVKAIERPWVEPKWQHLDRDAVQWAASSTIFSMIELTGSWARSVSVEVLLSKQIFTAGFYSRPPPLAEFLF